MNSTWQQGATAARAGVPSTGCPYSPSEYHFVTWMNGWAFAMHQMALETAPSIPNSDLF